MFSASLLLLLLCHHSAFGTLKNGKQYFVERPDNVNNVVAGGQILLRCKVGYLSGKVQWTRNGFALGYQPDMIKNYCGQCSLAGDADQGEYHLLVQNIRQDATYECQVSPDSRNNHKGIRAISKIKVLVPPTSLEMNPQVSVDMTAGTPEKLSCTAKGSSPKAKIVWYHRGMKILDQEYEERVTAGEIDGTWNTENIIIFNATSRDNDTRLSCVVEHKAIKKLKMRRDIRLNVFYPPGEPEILGDIVGEWRVGDHINMTCHVDTGNPPPEVFWFKNNKKLRSFQWRRLDNGSTVASFVGKVSVEDKSNTYTCKAWNSKSSIVVSSQPVRLNVTYGPMHVKISGPQRAHFGSKLKFSCTTEKSNPPASIRWSVNGKKRSGLQSSVKAVEGAWETESNMEIQVDSSNSKLEVECAAIHPTLGQTARKIRLVNIIRPPAPPQITGLPADKVLKEGDDVSLICSSRHGNPLPQLIWYKQGKKLKHQTFKMVEDSHSEAVLKIKVDRTDNKMNYRCQATNEANFVPANRNITLQVLFPPKDASVYMTPQGGGPNINIIRAGDSGELHCDVASSSPEPRVRWFREGKLMTPQGAVNSRKMGQHGGVTVSSTLPVNGGKPVTEGDDRRRFSCVVDNPGIAETNVTKQFTLSVRYKPTFNASLLERYSVIEGKSKTIHLDASANPSNVDFQWYNVSKPTVSFHDSSMSVVKASRTDQGYYVLAARNSIGETKKKIYLDIFYPPKILELTTQVEKNEGESVTFVCKIEANPITNKTVTWGRAREENFDFSRAEFSYDGKGKFSMTIQHIRKSDRGKFFCSADNELGEAVDKRETGLIVNFKPEIRKFPRQSKFSGELNQQVNLKCVAYGFPDVKMYWVRNGTMNPERYRAGGMSKQLDYATWESTLTIESIQEGDFADYKCVAKNDLGEDSHTISLVQPGLPDPPHNLVVTRHNYKTIRLQWSAGFDGGFSQQFETKVRELSTGAIVMEKILKHSTMEVSDEYVTQHIEDGLRPGVQYGFSLRAISELGKSKYCTEKIKSLEVLVMNARSKDESSEFMIVGLGVTLIILFIIILSISLVCKKQKNGKREKDKKRDRSHSVSTSSRRSILIERYPPSTPYTNALGGDMFMSPALDRTQSIFSDASEPDYKHYLGRSMSVPHDSGFPSYAGSCDIPTVISPLNRQVSSGIGMDSSVTTLDDDVFDESLSKDGEPKYNRLNSPSFTADMMLKGGRGRSGSVTSPYAYFSPPRLGVSGLPSQMTRSYRHYSNTATQPEKQPQRTSSATMGRLHTPNYISMLSSDNRKTDTEIAEELRMRMSELTHHRDVEPSNSLAHLQLPSLPELPKPAIFAKDLPKLPGYSPDLPDLPAFSSDMSKLPGYSSERKGHCSEMTGYHPELSLPGYAPKNRNLIV